MPMPALTQLSCKYGAPMGRRDFSQIGKEEAPKFYLQYVPFIDGCYDRGGAYWGAPANLYRAYAMLTVEGEDFEAEHFMRASSRDDAKRQVLEMYPKATFYR